MLEMLKYYVLTLGAVLCVQGSAQAMQMSVQQSQIFVAGVLDDGDPVQLRAAIAVNPKAKTLVLVNVTGSDMAVGLALGRIVREHAMETLVSGYCLGACAPAFLSGKERGFAVGEHPRRTLLGVQGAYDKSGKRDAALTQRVMDLIKGQTGSNFDERVVTQAMNEARDAGGMLRMRELSRTAAADRNAFFCESGQTLIPDCTVWRGKDALSLGFLTTAAVADIAIPEPVRPKPDFFGRVLAPGEGDFKAQFMAHGVAMCKDNQACAQRWQAAVPVFHRQKPHRAAALGAGVIGLGFSDDQETFDLAAKRAIYLCNHAANNKKLCRVVAIDEVDVAAEYTRSEEESSKALAQLPNGPLSGRDDLSASGAQPAAALRVGDLFAATPSGAVGVRTWSTQELVDALKTKPPVLVDVLGAAPQMLPGAIHFWEGGLALADPASDKAFEQRFGDMLKFALRTPDTPVVFYCRDHECWHAVNAALRTARLGYTQVGWYRGGLDAWAKAKLPLVRKVPAAVIH